MQVKTTVRYHVTPIRMTAILKKQKIICVDEDVEILEPSCTVGGKVKQYSHYGKQ